VRPDGSGAAPRLAIGARLLFAGRGVFELARCGGAPAAGPPPPSNVASVGDRPAVGLHKGTRCTWSNHWYGDSLIIWMTTTAA
jgi:hypothetical protein